MSSRMSNADPDRFRKLLGARGEQAAVDLLTRKGYEILDRNWSLSFGELDIVAKQGVELVFVEVKTRLNAPEAERYLFETLTQRKQNKLRQLAQIYLDRKFGHCGKRPTYRIDVVGVIIEARGLRPIKIQQLINAV